ncbi:MAG: pyridoxal phosphate-dependent aminotransferase [Acidobacteria bacterium]|nr:pyridoxal phosphate-dependent aminotransferase [Acidobacteriota bacterium]
MARAVSRRRRLGAPILDLTLSNPTLAGLASDPGVLAALTHPAGTTYAPDPRGDADARVALARDLARRRPAKHRPRAQDLVLAASTSEAYSWLFKLLCDPGDEILVPAPGYPLFTHLAALEGVEAVTYPLALQDRWRLDLEDVAVRVTSRTRAMVVISPHNPTGWTLSNGEAAALMKLAAARDLVVISDEVFADFQFMGHRDWCSMPEHAAGKPAPCLALAGRGGRRVSLGGLSKEAGLPQMKVGWLLLGGEARWRREALARLDLIADTYLSLATPQQKALPDWLRGAWAYRREVRRRLKGNRRVLARTLRQACRGELLPAAGGWSAVIRLPGVREDQEDALALLREEGVLVHPGYYYDFTGGTFLVISLLPRPGDFAEGVARLAVYLDRRHKGGGRS